MAPKGEKKEKIPRSTSTDLLLSTMHTRKIRVASDNSMIRIYSDNCNILKSKTGPDFFTFTSPPTGIPDLSTIHCPACRARGMFENHGYYSRYVIDLRKGKPETYRISIRRVKCACGHTHALLKDALIPYCQYSLRFILQVLKSYFRHSRTIAEICERFQIAPPTLYRLKKLFLSHRELWTGLVLSIRQSPASFLKFLEHQKLPSVFLHSFFRLTALSFLQSHANPAYS